MVGEQVQIVLEDNLEDQVVEVDQQKQALVLEEQEIHLP